MAEVVQECARGVGQLEQVSCSESAGEALMKDAGN